MQDGKYKTGDKSSSGNQLVYSTSFWFGLHMKRSEFLNIIFCLSRKCDLCKLINSCAIYIAENCIIIIFIFVPSHWGTYILIICIIGVSSVPNGFTMISIDLFPWFWF